MKDSNVIETEEFKDFIVSCHNYCNLLESNSKIESDEFLIQVQNLLLHCYFKSKLPYR